MTYCTLQVAAIAGGVGVGVGVELVEVELVEDELVVDCELLDVDSDDVVVLVGGFIVSVQETVVNSFEVDDELVEVESVESELVRVELIEVKLVFCWVVEGGIEELRFCDDAEGPAVPVIEDPFTAPVPDVVEVKNVEFVVVNTHEVVPLGAKVE